MTKMFTIYVGFGSEPESGQDTVAYEFATEAEMNAFIHGVEQTIGWQDAAMFFSPHRYSSREGDWVVKRPRAKKKTAQ